MKQQIKDSSKDSVHKGKSSYATKVRTDSQMYGGLQRKFRGVPKGIIKLTN